MDQKKSISSHKLFALIKNNNVEILDVRGKEEFERGHIFGAQHVPVDDLSNRHHELKSEKTIVTYCGKGAGRSERAAKILNENGKTSLWLEGGYLEWPFISAKWLSGEKMKSLGKKGANNTQRAATKPIRMTYGDGS